VKRDFTESEQARTKSEQALDTVAQS